MRDSLTMLTLTYRPEDAHEAAVLRGYAVVRGMLEAGGATPLAFLGRCESGVPFVRVLCGGRVSWVKVRDVWCSVAPGAVSVHAVRGSAFLGLLQGCESLLCQSSVS